jgi:hypothetical protein
MGWVVNAMAAFPLGIMQYPFCKRMGAENFAPQGFFPWTIQSVVRYYTDYAILAHPVAVSTSEWF